VSICPHWLQNRGGLVLLSAVATSDTTQLTKPLDPAESAVGFLYGRANGGVHHLKDVIEEQFGTHALIGRLHRVLNHRRQKQRAGTIQAEHEQLLIQKGEPFPQPIRGRP
jgi:hypothetical protein